MKHEIENCLAYHVLRSSSSILGTLTTAHLGSFLYGATYRAILTCDRYPAWRIDGVLTSREFFKQTYKVDTKLQGWRRSIDISIFSPEKILSKLGNDAERWHINFGVDKNQMAYIYHYAGLPLQNRIDAFWPHFLKRPAMHFECMTGWGLYCFLAGMVQGGDWLKLPEISCANELLKKLKAKSDRIYGTEFAAFRARSTASELLKWGNELEAEN